MGHNAPISEIRWKKNQCGNTRYESHVTDNSLTSKLSPLWIQHYFCERKNMHVDDSEKHLYAYCVRSIKKGPLQLCFFSKNDDCSWVDKTGLPLTDSRERDYSQDGQ